ncbi:MAG: PEGA domain-containing protein [Candidatus Aminicenantes bacterium]|nr:PEGA domain-containing protein [Candidatus Aminicenantes bacterium]
MESKNFSGGIRLLSIFLLFFLLVSLEAAPVKIKVILDNASIKATRAIGGKTLTRVPLNTILDAESKIGDWYKVTWQGSSGYIHAMNVDEVSERELAGLEAVGPGRPFKSQPEIVAEIEIKMEEGRKLIRQDKDFEKAISALEPLIAEVFKVADHKKQRELGAELYLWLGLASAEQGDAYSALNEFKSMFKVNYTYAKEITRNILDPQVVALIEQAEKLYLGLITEYSVEISTVPKEAKIKVNGEEIGLSPEIYRTSNPKIVIEIEKAGYKSVREEFFITQATTGKEYTLERAGIDVEVKSAPEGAKVYLDGEDTKQVTNCVLKIVPFGSHKIKLMKENYAEWEDEIKIEAGKKSLVFEMALTPNKYEYILKWGGPASELFDQPSGIAVDKDNNIYIVDSARIKMKKINPKGRVQTSWGDSGKQFKIIKNPTSIAVDNQGNVYITDAKTHSFMKFDRAGIYKRKWGTEGAGNLQFKTPSGVAVDGKNDIYIVDSGNHRVKKYNSRGALNKIWGKQGTADGDFVYPKGIAVSQKNEVFVIDRARVQKFSSEGEFIASWGKRGTADGAFNNPQGIFIDNNNFVYVADSGSNRIQKFDENGKFIAKWGTPGVNNGQMQYPVDIAIDSRGYVYVVERKNNRVQLFSVVGPSESK